MNDKWTWEGSPKNGFQRRRLERCWNLPTHGTKDTTYRGLGVGRKESYENPQKPVVKTKPEEVVMSYKNRPSSEPYWNFWKVVFAGWLIRYPMQILKGIGAFVFGLFLFGVLVMNPEPDYNNNTTPSGEVRE